MASLRRGVGLIRGISWGKGGGFGVLGALCVCVFFCVI